MSERPIEPTPSGQQIVPKKSKGLKKVRSSKGQTSSELLPRFVDDKATERYTLFCSPSPTQKIVPCYFINASKISELRLTKVMDIFGDLSAYLTCDEVICEPIIWEFYANMDKIGTEITSRVNDKDIRVNPSKVRSAFGITLDGTAFNPYFASSWPDKDWCEENRFDLVDLSQKYFKVQWHKNISSKKEYKPMNLAALDRIVYELMWRLLANSSGHSSEPTIAQVLFFFALMEGKKIDYARYLIEYLIFAYTGGKDLPCGNLIIKVLKHLKIKSPLPPTIPSYLECREITKDFFKNKRVEYKEIDSEWHIMLPKNPPYKSSRREGSSSNMGNEDLDARIERAIEKAQAPLLEKIGDLESGQTPLFEKIEGLERALEKSLVLQSTLIDELDVMRQSHLMDMDATRYNKVVAYRKELENQRVARLGESAKNLRSDALRSSRHDEEESSSERTHTPSGNQSQSGGS